MSKLRVVAAATLAAVTGAACADSPMGPAAARSSAASIVATSNCVTMIAGQKATDGSICVTRDGDNLTLTYTAPTGVLLSSAHAWVGTAGSAVPTNKAGNVQNGQMPYTAGNINAATYSFTVTPPAGYDACADQLHVYAHAALSNGESATGLGSRVSPKGSWFMSHTIPAFDCAPVVEEPTVLTDETAFAMNDDATAFSALGINRWGWTNELKDGSYKLIAGQHTEVGTVTVSGSTVTISTAAGYYLGATHLYAGSTQLAQDCKTTGKDKIETCTATVAPGQYGRETTHDPLVTTVTYTGVTGSYFIAHAVVWGNFGK